VPDLQNLIQGHLLSHLTAQETGLALAITFGFKNTLSRELLDEIKIVGVSHMMVLSGANITMFITFVSSVLSFLPNKMREVCAIAITALFLFSIPMQPSIIRAALMNFIPRIGDLIGKQSHRLYLLFFTCGLILCFDSTIVYDISFQLSFLAIFGITLFYNGKQPDMKESNIVIRLREMMRDQIALSFSAQAFTVPLIFYYFGNISLISPFANILLSPLISPIMISSLGIIITSGYLPILAETIGAFTRVLLNILTFVIHSLSTLRFLYVQY
jgi:competence protein ComEC